MHATTATWRDGGSGSGPEKDLAYSVLLARYSSVTDMGVPFSTEDGEALGGSPGWR
jgi:hypothetical protein